MHEPRLYETSSSVLLAMLKWDTLPARTQKEKAVMMFKSLHKLAPVYLQDLFNERSSYYDLRNSSGKLTLPKPRTGYLKRSPITEFFTRICWKHQIQKGN